MRVAVLDRMLALTSALLTLSVHNAVARPAGSSLQARAQAYVDPRSNGGSMLTTTDSASGGLGEPINVIVSGESDAAVLTPDGIREYFESLFYSPGSCLGISLGGPQQANLGDGNGYVNQTDVFRFNYYQGDGGTCLETINGGNHFRYFPQNGPSANTGAIFLAVSYELSAQLEHDIVPDGYNLGRDVFVGNATNSSGTTSPGGYQYTTSNTTAALLSDTQVSQLNHGIAVDGNVAILTVRVTKTGSMGANRASGTSGGSDSSAIALGVGPLALGLAVVAASTSLLM